MVILVKGKAVLEGKLSKIKKDYRKRDIKVIGDINIDKIKKIKGVNKVIKNENEIVIKIKDESIVDKVFKEVSKGKDITKFIVEEASLEEIFIDKVGEVYAK